MGYDMYFDRADEATMANTAAARAELDQAVRARDSLVSATTTDGDHERELAQEVVMQAYEKLRESQTDYFRLNIWGMGLACDLMFDFDMTYNSAPDGDFPDLPGDDYDPDDDPDPAYEEASRTFLTSGVTDRPGIANHKFGSNDGWHVTELECLGAVAQWRKWCDAQGHPYDYIPHDRDNAPVEWWPKWVAWLEAAGTHGGFRVH